MDICERLKREFTDCHPSEIDSAVSKARVYAAANSRNLTEYDSTALVFLHAAMHLTRSDHLRQCYRASILAVLHPYQHEAGVGA